ncbi:short-chain dehydrogenase TIC 32, chloroplastic-like isoform X2 [Gossypium arboreum]|uniref:short-chain dehydrogenase TIC 32, chloroplastic-like isoform X2 n=1 Tax=Gossypium arboreum TaxID=29729 RepID=UPI0022F1A1FE|nr:short-chain dehydrogenase TIC 32, chloroplastic-like isoform X2 [Gossypium arboreum]
MAVKNMTAGREVKDTIAKRNPNAKIDAMELDLSSLASVRKFAADFISSGLPLNILMYNSLSAYGQSKLANVLHAKDLARRLKEDEVAITANSLHPGAIATNLFRHSNLINGIVGLVGKYVIKNVEQQLFAMWHCIHKLQGRLASILQTVM